MSPTPTYQEPSQRSEIVEEPFAPTHVSFELVQHVNAMRRVSKRRETSEANSLCTSLSSSCLASETAFRKQRHEIMGALDRLEGIINLRIH